MELVVKHFSQLTADELFEIYRVRVAVFVVEQRCPYQEVDENDRRAYHFWLSENNSIIAYLRLFEEQPASMKVRIGRVLSLKRHQGLATRMVSEAVAFAKGRLNAREINLDAQSYVRELYQAVGFKVSGDEFLEDGIAHVPMKLLL